MVVVSIFRAFATSRWLAPLLLAGCLGGQTGTEEIIDGEAGGGPATDNGSPCKDEEQPVPADDASLGFAFEDIAGFVVGEHQTDLAWSTGNPSVSFGPESGTSSLDISIDWTGGVTRLHAVPQSESGGAGPAIAIGCPPDRLAADVTLRLTSGGGALAEQVPARIVAASAGRAELDVSIPLENVQGTFRVTLQPGSVTRALSLRAVFTELGFAGDLSGGVESSNGMSASHMGVTYARFPAQNPCTSGALAIPVPLTAPGASELSDLLAAVRTGEQALAWKSGGTTTIDFEVTPAEVACQSGDGVTSGTTLSLPVLAVSTADGRVDTLLAGSLTRDASGTHLGATRTCDGADQAQQLERCGLADFDPSGHTNLFLSLSATLAADGVFRGSLDLLGIPVTNCPASPDGACGSPGPAIIDGGEF